MTPYELAAITWALDKATGGIFSEYVKRAWFGTFHKQEGKVSVLERELQTAVRAYAQLESDARELQKQNEEFARAVVELRKENSLLRKKYCSPPRMGGGAI